jgi:hypothetical protein
MDHLGTLNDETPRIRVGPEGAGMDPDVIFGLDTGLWEKSGLEGKSWADLAGGNAGWHGDEVEVKAIRRGGRREASCQGGHEGHLNGEGCSTSHEQTSEVSCDAGPVIPLDRETLDGELSKLSFEIYRGEPILRAAGDVVLINAVKGIVRLLASDGETPYTTHILNYAFGRYDLTAFPSLDLDPALEGVSIRLTVMGERGEVTRRAKRLADGLQAKVI